MIYNQIIKINQNNMIKKMSINKKILISQNQFLYFKLLKKMIKVLFKMIINLIQIIMVINNMIYIIDKFLNYILQIDNCYKKQNLSKLKVNKIAIYMYKKMILKESNNKRNSSVNN